MTAYEGLTQPHDLDFGGLRDNLLRQGRPARAYHMELFQDGEIAQAIADRFDLANGLDRNDPAFAERQYIAVQRFCGFDYVRVGLTLDFPLHKLTTTDTADLARSNGRAFQDEHVGPITSWDDFEAYPWPDPTAPELTSRLEWFQANLPDDMCIIGSGGLGHFHEYLTWLMGYESLCYALFDQRDLVQAIADKLLDIYRICVERVLQFERVTIVWASDDMGFKTGLMISPDDTREFVLRGHKALAEMAHAAGRPYLLHACGNLTDIIEDLIDDVKIDAKHSFEDTIEDVREVKYTYGQRIALIGGIDVDFLCRSDEATIRQRTRDTLDTCMPGGGYCLGTGNSVANYIPLDNYLAMVDEGWLYGR